MHLICPQEKWKTKVMQIWEGGGEMRCIITDVQVAYKVWYWRDSTWQLAKFRTCVKVSIKQSVCNVLRDLSEISRKGVGVGILNLGSEMSWPIPAMGVKFGNPPLELGLKYHDPPPLVLMIKSSPCSPFFCSHSSSLHDLNVLLMFSQDFLQQCIFCKRSGHLHYPRYWFHSFCRLALNVGALGW